MTDRESPAGFPPLGRADWEALVRASQEVGSLERLVSRTPDGIEVRPLYLPEDGLPAAALSYPGAPPFGRGSSAAGATREGWDTRTVRAESSAELCNRAILDDLEGGATSIELRIAAQGDRDGLHVSTLDDLDRALRGVHLEAIVLGLDAGAAFASASSAVVALLRRRALDPRAQRAAFGADPLGTLARTGVLPQGAEVALAELAALAVHVDGEVPLATAARADGAPYHDAGASDAVELACVLATGVAYLRAMTAGSVAADRSLGHVELALSLDADLFAGIAKLRAGRRLWSRVAEECGVPADRRGATLRLQARAGRRMLADRDPLLDLLRVTSAALAAAAGGATVIEATSFDDARRLPGELGRRLARNAQLILAEEAHFHRVLDPAGGSWYVEHLTEALCERAWEHFRDLERRGGMLAVLADGSLARELAEAASVRDREVATRRETRVGVNRFASLETTVAESRTAHVPEPGGLTGGAGPFAAQVAAWLAGTSPAPAGEPAPTLVEALPVRPLSGPFEVLRADSDRELALAGTRPRVFLAALGAPRDHAARSDWARDLLAAGGLEAVDRGAFGDAAALAGAYREAGTPVAFLCSSDERYASLGEAAARALRDEGAQLLLLAGSLRDTPELERRLRDAGVDALVHDGADVIATLHRIWSALEPAPRTRAGAAAATAATAAHAAAAATEQRQ